MLLFRAILRDATLRKVYGPTVPLIPATKAGLTTLLTFIELFDETLALVLQ